LFEAAFRQEVRDNPGALRLEPASRTCSYHIFGKPGSVVRLSVPVHGNQALKRGLLAHLTKLAGLEESDLE
jgi:hypothetical protein